MSKLKLVLPEEISQEMFEDFKQEFLDYGVTEGVGVMLEQDFDTWQKQAISYRYEENLPEGWVPATTFLSIRESDGKLIGRIDVRHRLTEHLLSFGGHIGYAIRPSEQRKGYGKEQLRLALEYCRELGIERALVTCNKLNIASAKTILSCGGKFENEWNNGERITQRYWIDVK
ncbi:MAG: GNAT family N-acetyltransferase [Oscillospiraceae bacterium]|nr:GNAT family N-acetyltransferase [Oscillospiraceae bacterium]